MKRFYVYALTDASGKPFYIGKGCGDRLYWHESQARAGTRGQKYEMIRRIWANGQQVGHAVVMETAEEAAAYAFESDLIEFYGSNRLTNIHPATRDRKVPVASRAGIIGEIIIRVPLEPGQKEQLRVLAFESRTTQAEICRQAIAAFLASKSLSAASRLYHGDFGYRNFENGTALNETADAANVDCF